MKRVSVHNPLALLAIMVFCQYGFGCGSGGERDGGSNSLSDSSRSQVAATTSPMAFPPSTSITGDYDGDDDYGKTLRHDGDNDDDGTPTDRDNDSDNSSHSYYDRDDEVVRGLGRAASMTETKDITGLVRRYFAAATAEDGTKACSMIVPAFANSIPETLGRSSGLPYARGASCAVVASKIFVHYHRQLAAHMATLEVDGVRVDHDHGVAILDFGSLPGRQIHVIRQGAAWQINALLDLELP